MTYIEYVESFVGITEDEWNNVVRMFPNCDIDDNVISNLSATSDKNDLIMEIIYNIFDPNYEYIGGIRFDNNSIIIEELPEVVDIENWRKKLEEFLELTPFIIDYE